MNLSDLAYQDNAGFIEDESAGFAKEVILTDLSGEIYQVMAIQTRVGVDIDPETGLLVAGNKLSFTVRASRFRADNQPDEGWSVSAIDMVGNAIKGRVTYAMSDKTLGMITILVKR